MANFELYYNPDDGTTGANIVATIQKAGSGLGDVWDFTNVTWAPFASVAYADRTLQVTESSPIGQTVGYYRVFDLNTTYTGKVSVGYFDGNFVDTKHPLFTEVRYVRRGVDLNLVIAGDRLSEQVSDAFVAHLSRRGDDKIVSLNDIKIADSDVRAFAFELAPLIQKGTYVADINSITVSPSGMNVIKLGGQGTRAVLSVEGGQVSGTTYTVSCVALLSDSDQIECNVQIICKTPFA